MLKPIANLAFMALVVAGTPALATADPVAYGPYVADTLSIDRFAGRLIIETGSFDGIRLWIDGPAEKRDAIEVLERQGTLVVKTPRSAHTALGGTNVIISGNGTSQIIINGTAYEAADTAPVTLRIEMPPEIAVDISAYVGTATLDDLNAPLSIELFSGEVLAGAAKDCTLTVRGAGTLKVATATGDRLDMVLEGSGAITVDTGTVNRVKGAIDGSGNLRFGGRADHADIAINGVGTVSLRHVNQRPRVSIDGVGSVDIGNW